MPEKPENWDPIHPPDRICVWCYGPAPFYAVWKYGVTCTCYEGKCVTFTNGMIGFDKRKGMLHRQKASADRAYDVLETERRAGESNKRAK